MKCHTLRHYICIFTVCQSSHLEFPVYKEFIVSPFKIGLSYDVASGSEITPCNKIDKPLVYGKRYNVHNNVAYIMTKLKRFYARNEISKYLSCDK